MMQSNECEVVLVGVYDICLAHCGKSVWILDL